MRLAFILATTLSLAGPALASSIAPVTGTGSAGSIVTLGCKDCPAQRPRASAHSYIVPVLKPGTQLVEIKDIDGQRKLVRTEAWMGGSPVVYIGKAPNEAKSDVAAEAKPAATPLSAIATEAQAIEAAPLGDMRPSHDSIDKSATTSALAIAPQTGATEATEAEGHTDALDTSKFELRSP